VPLDLNELRLKGDADAETLTAAFETIYANKESFEKFLRLFIKAQTVPAAAAAGE
jgi:hypothetical protein